MKLGKILFVLSLVLFFQGNYPSPTLAQDKEVKVKPKDKRIIVRKGLVSDDTKLRSVKVYWELPEGDETHKWKIEGFEKSVVPVKYIPNESVSLVVEGGPKNSRAEVRVRVHNRRAGGSIIIFERNLELDFDDKEIGVFSIKMDDLLKDCRSRVNQNAFEAWVSVGSGRRKRPAISKNLLHILKQKLILFIPGIFGSRIRVRGHADAEAFPEWSTGFGWNPEFMWLKCYTSGVPLNEAVWLDLFRKFEYSGETGWVYPDLEDRDEVKNPPHYPFLYCDGVRVPHYILRAWPYDWRLKLENAVDRLMGPPSDGTTWPPYAVPPSLPQIIREAKEGTFDDREDAGPHLYKYMDDKIAIACHSTGGLITRGVLCRQGIEDYVDKAFFINVPFWGAPKAYYVYLSGDMGIPFINNKYMQSLAPNMPIIYYLAPTEKYPDVVAVLPGPPNREVGRQPDQSVATAFMDELIAEARRRKNVYPPAGKIDPWNKGLENAAKIFHRSIQSKPLIGYENCHVFWSLAVKPTPGPVFISFTSEDPLNYRILFRNVAGDSTCPEVSQRADFLPECLNEIPGDIEHVPAPTTTSVWKTIIEILSDATPANADGRF